MRKYSVYSGQFAVSTSTNTNTYPIGLISGTTRTYQIYELILGASTASVDTLSIAQINGTSAALTAGTAITPSPIEIGDTASVTTASSAPTGMTIAPTNPYLSIPFNGRVTVRWLAGDPDSRIILPAGGGAAGSALVSVKQIGTTAYNVDTTLFFAE